MNRDKYWRSEYENLRRKKNRQIERMKNAQLQFLEKTWNLLKELGMSDAEILMYYRKELDG